MDLERVVLFGDSAGGQIACVIVQTALEEFHRNLFRRLVLIYPAMESRAIPDEEYTWEERNLIYENTWGFPYKVGAIMAEWYFVKEENVLSPVGSPVFIEDYSGFPETVMFTNEYDALRIPARTAYEKMKKCGLNVKYVCVKNAVHALWGSKRNTLGYNDLVLKELKLCCVCCTQRFVRKRGIGSCNNGIRKRKRISPKWDSNTRPAAYEADALPTELLRHLLPSLPTVLWESQLDGSFPATNH